MTVLYDPGAPQDAEIYLRDDWPLPAVLCFIGAAPALMHLSWTYRQYRQRARLRRKGARDDDSAMTWPGTSRRPKLPR